RDARRHVRAGTCEGSRTPAAPPEDSPDLRLHRPSRRSARWAGPGGADPEQALPPARTGGGGALGAGGGLTDSRVVTLPSAGLSLVGTGNEQEDHNEIRHREHRIDDKDPEHRAF